MEEEDTRTATGVFELQHMESTCFWRALPDHDFEKKNSHWIGSKKAKERVTIAFLVNADGQMEDTIVIWKSENPRCFKGINKTKLPV